MELASQEVDDRPAGAMSPAELDRHLERDHGLAFGSHGPRLAYAIREHANLHRTGAEFPHPHSHGGTLRAGQPDIP